MWRGMGNAKNPKFSGFAKPDARPDKGVRHITRIIKRYLLTFGRKVKSKACKHRGIKRGWRRPLCKIF